MILNFKELLQSDGHSISNLNSFYGLRNVRWREKVFPVSVLLRVGYVTCAPKDEDYSVGRREQAHESVEKAI